MKITEIKKYPLSHDGRISLYIEVCTDNGLKGLERLVYQIWEKQ